MPKPDDTLRLPLSAITIAAERFQFKSNVDAGGVTYELKDVSRWEPDAEGVSSVWHDPENGLTYMVNGHHRYELAARLGQSDLRCRYLDADSPVVARTRGALINIREGRGTALDAAKVFRDAALTPDDLCALGISTVKGTVARDGMSLSRLHPVLFSRVVSGRMGFYRGVTIGRELRDHTAQVGLLAMLDEYEADGKKALTDDGIGCGGELMELIRQVQGAGTVTHEQKDLFGTHLLTESLAIPKARLSNYIRKRLGREKRTFQFVSERERVTLLTSAGNKITPQTNKARSIEAAQVLEIYDRLSARKGPVADLLTTQALRLAAGEDADVVKDDAYRAAVNTTLRIVSNSEAEREEAA